MHWSSLLRSDVMEKHRLLGGMYKMFFDFSLSVNGAIITRLLHSATKTSTHLHRHQEHVRVKHCCC